MDIKIEDLKNYEEVSDELLEKVKNKIKEICDNYNEDNFMENDFEFEYEGNTVTSEYLDESIWEDEGKYQCQSEYRQLIMKNNNDEIIKQYNLFFDIAVGRSGSYFSDYTYDYSIPTIQIANIKHIPEQIILAHDIVDFKEV